MWTFGVVALLGFCKGRASGTATKGAGEHSSLACPDATAAWRIAWAPLSEFGQLAVGWATVMVTGLGLTQVRAHPFTLVGVGDNLTYTRRRADATALGAFTPETPVRNFAVQSARALVA